MTKRHVLVVGSKPYAVFPQVTPVEIFSANGALARVQDFHSHPGTKLTAVIFKRFFLSTKEWQGSSTAELLSNCVADRLFITGGGPKHASYDTPKERGLNVLETQTVGRLHALTLKMQYASSWRLLENLSDRTNDGMSLLKKIRTTRTLPSLGISTGVFAVLLALNDYRNDPDTTLSIVGIGIDEEEGAFNDDKSVGRFKHLAADKAMLRDLARSKYASRLNFTDPPTASFFARSKQTS